MSVIKIERTKNKTFKVEVAGHKIRSKFKTFKSASKGAERRLNKIEEQEKKKFKKKV